MDQDTQVAKEARKKKIKELEASLFGKSTEDWINKTDLPTLQNVDEFSAKFNMAETKKPLTSLPKLKPKSKKNFLQKITQKKVIKDGFDGIPLISDDESEGSDNEDTTVIKVL